MSIFCVPTVDKGKLTSDGEEEEEMMVKRPRKRVCHTNETVAQTNEKVVKNNETQQNNAHFDQNCSLDLNVIGDLSDDLKAAIDLVCLAHGHSSEKK